MRVIHIFIGAIRPRSLGADGHLSCICVKLDFRFVLYVPFDSSMDTEK